MEPEHLITTATVASLVWSLGALTSVLYRPRKASRWCIGYAVSSVVVVLAVLWLDSIVSLGRNTVVHVWHSLTGSDLHHLCAAGLGGSIGLTAALWPWQLRLNQRLRCKRARLLKVAGFLGIVGGFGFLSLLAAQEQIEPYVKRRGIGSIVANPVGFATPPGFVLDEYHDCGFGPVQLTVGPDGDLYASGYWGAAFQQGVVARIARGNGGRPVETMIARNLGRPHGLAFHDGQLYVSRCGQYVKAEGGALVGVSTGAVTLLRDLDGDGLIDYFEDVVSGLPGAQGPDPLHQNNGICFDTAGNLFITVGTHADRAPTSGPFDGTIVRVAAGTATPEVFARGVRNPFDLVIGPDGELFGGDNDSSDRRNGDEVNHYVAGGHYGYPYADGSHPHPEGTIAPLAITKNGTFQGLVYATSEKLPPEVRDCIYAVSYGNGEILRVELTRHGDTYRATTSVFARVPGALDIAIDEEGVFYISCFEAKKIYRLRPVGVTP